MDSPSSSRAGFSLRQAKFLVLVFAVLAAVGVVMFTALRLERQTPVNTAVKPEGETVAVVPKKDNENKTDFGTNVPEDFPTNIPLPAGVSMTQSYALDYPGQKQLTAVFSSPDTVKQNYDQYAEFLKQDAWTISNTYESKTLASLYALKDTNEINITVNAMETGSQVSISVLKK